MARSVMGDPLDVRPCVDGGQWSDQTFAAWLTGFFDRAGRIDLRRQRSVVLTIYDLHPHTLSLVQQNSKPAQSNRPPAAMGRCCMCGGFLNTVKCGAC